MRDLLSNLQTVSLGTVTLAGTTPAVSAYVDTLGFNSATIAVIATDTTDAGTAAGYTVTLQESADTAGASAGAVASAEAVNGITTLTATVDSFTGTVGGLGYNGSDRYLGVTATGTTGTDVTLEIVAILGKPASAPTTFAGVSVARA